MPAFEHCQTCIRTFHVPADEAPVVPEGQMCLNCIMDAVHFSEDPISAWKQARAAQPPCLLAPTHPTMPHDHEDVIDESGERFRQILIPHGGYYVLKHYWEVQVWAPMHGRRDPDYNSLLAYFGFNGGEGSRSCPASAVLGKIDAWLADQESMFLASIDEIRPFDDGDHWWKRDRF